MNFIFGQDYHTMEHEGNTRQYYVSYPEITQGPAPLIIAMHGFGGNAYDFIFSTDLDSYAHPNGVAVVYPQGLGSSWSVGTFWTSFNNSDDVDFIRHLYAYIPLLDKSLIDVIKEDHFFFRFIGFLK